MNTPWLIFFEAFEKLPVVIVQRRQASEWFKKGDGDWKALIEDPFLSVNITE